jgi:hypothetical protein
LAQVYAVGFDGFVVEAFLIFAVRDELVCVVVFHG